MGKSYSRAAQRIASQTNTPEMSRPQLVKFLEDMDCDVQLKNSTHRYPRSRHFKGKGEDRSVVLAAAMMEVHEVLEDLGSGLSPGIRRRIEQMRGRVKVDTLTVRALEQENDAFSIMSNSENGMPRREN